MLRILIQKNGLTYEGAFEYGRPHGTGTLTGTLSLSLSLSLFLSLALVIFCRNDFCAGTWGVQYVGMWQSGLMSGKGNLHYGNGDAYEGEFLNGMR